MKKHFIFLTSVLATTVLSSIGFATWIITGNSEVNAGGNAVVDDISDSRLGITYEWANGTESDKKTTSFIFGWNGTVNASDWLINKTNETKEKLSDTLNITISNVNYLEKLEFDLTTDGGKWKDAASANYVVAPTLTFDTNKLVKKDDGNGTYALDVKFSWGTAFNSKNPYIFYNSEDFGNDIANEAKTHINNLKEYLTDVKFILTIKATAKANTTA